jgi:hypothetical protein
MKEQVTGMNIIKEVKSSIIKDLRVLPAIYKVADKETAGKG